MGSIRGLKIFLRRSEENSDNVFLRAKGYRTIHFRKHRYLMVYSLQGNTAYVEGIYHDLQDYENALR